MGRPQIFAQSFVICRAESNVVYLVELLWSKHRRENKCSRSRVRRKEAGERKLGRRRRRNGEGENVMKTKIYDVRLDGDVTSDAHLL